MDTEGQRRPRWQIAVVIGVGLVLWVGGQWFGTPDSGRSGFSSFEGDEIRCHLLHDGWLFPEYEETVVLSPGGDAFSGRVGPHDVTLRFVKEANRRGLEHEYLTRSLGGTSGGSNGTDERSVDTITGLGVGALTVTCVSDQAV